MIKCIVFLGNPGKEYERTRHNAAFLLCDFIYGKKEGQEKFHSIYFQDGNIRILKPRTYMNLSGTAVSGCSSFFKLKRDEIMVVHDDIELKQGEARIQKGGGTRGHNGLRDIRDRLGGEDFFRLRIGIGRPVHGDVRLFVTSVFTGDEMITMSQLFSLIKRSWPPCAEEKVFKI